MIIQNSISQVLATNLWEILIKSQGVGIPPTSSVEGGGGGRGSENRRISPYPNFLSSSDFSSNNWARFMNSMGRLYI